ncbi:MAG TPA: acyl-CoA reductase [Candidatus Acidoferrales bacterium]|nr:acyl-CoA reductase [Candidatus Acidoferrales bacterium]
MRSPAEDALRTLPAREIVRAIADAGQRWCDADFPPRVRATRAVTERLSYTEPVVDYALDRLFGAITREALHATIESELGSLDALDGFAQRPGRPAAFARGVSRVAIISSDTTIGVALVPMLFALCAKADVAVKDRSDQLIGAFAQTLAQEQPAFASAMDIGSWPQAGDFSAAVADADVVVAFGRPAALQAIRAACKPEARFLPFGHRTSFGYLPRAALMDIALARHHAAAAARDTLLYDGDGCLSLHALFVEEGGAVSPSALAQLLASACDEAATEFPAASHELSPSSAAYRERARFRSAQGIGVVYDGRRGAHLVVYDPPRDEPPALTPRTIGVYPVHQPSDLVAYVRAQHVPLEAIAVPPGTPPDLISILAATGAARIALLGQLQNPPLAGNHGGEQRITPFVSFVYRDDE